MTQLTDTTQPWSYAGARWWKVDFHTHTPASTDWEKSNAGASRPTPAEWLLKFMRAGADCVAVTDHNSGAWIDKLKDAYAALKADKPAGFRPLCLFPGVELSVNGGIHLLAIFDVDKSTSDIDSLLGAVGYQGTKGGSDGVTTKTLVEVIEEIVKAGGIAIPAHADKGKGLLQLDGSGRASPEIDAGTLRQSFDCGQILAMEVIDRTSVMPQVYKDSECAWTEILGSDFHGACHGNRLGTRFTWVKMSRPALEGLRLALLDGEPFSIRRSDDPEPFDPSQLPKHAIESIEIQDTRYMGRGEPATLRFSPSFNAVVGGRGTGKSTIVHALRLAFRRDAELPAESEARRTFDRFKREPQSRNDESGALDYQASKKTAICVALKRDESRHRLFWRQDGSGGIVQDWEEGVWRGSARESFSTERFPIRIFSQGQIAALAGESQGALLGLIDEAAHTQSVRERLEQARKGFLTLRAKLRELESKLRAHPKHETALSDVMKKLASFGGRQHAEILRDYQRRSLQSREVDRQIGAADGHASRLLEAVSALVADDLPAGLFDPADTTDQLALAVVQRVHEAAEKAAAEIRMAAEQLRETAARERQSLASNDWWAAVLAARSKYAELNEELKQSGVNDPGEYGKLVQQRQEIEDTLKTLDAIGQERDRLAKDAAAQRAAILEARREVSRLRERFLTEALGENHYVRMDVQHYGRGARSIERQLRELLGVMDDRFSEDILAEDESKGAVAELLRDLPGDSAGGAAAIEWRVEKLVQDLVTGCTGAGRFGGHFTNFLKREAERRPEFVDNLLTWFPEDSLRVQYSPGGDGRDFRSIAQASAGQKAAAMLALLLAYGDEPLVLDQPEDDLDNHLIYELVVRQIRENKLRRQIIAVTHNPNIVVNGDAEMLHAMEFKNGQCQVILDGSLQEAGMREEVCRVMEGGREAFERRYRRLGKGLGRELTGEADV